MVMTHRFHEKYEIALLFCFIVVSVEVKQMVLGIIGASEAKLSNDRVACSSFVQDKNQPTPKMPVLSFN